MTRRNARKQEWVFPLFSPDSDDRLSLNFHRFVILYISCDTRSVGLGQYCLPKVYNGFNSIKLSPLNALFYIPFSWRDVAAFEARSNPVTQWAL